MTKDFNRRDFFRLGAVGAAALAIGKGFESKALAGTVSFVKGERIFLP